MLRSSLYTAGALLLCASTYGQEAGFMVDSQQRIRPVTSPIHQLEGNLDLRTGKFTRTRTTIGDDGKQSVYDNTCFAGFFIGLAPAGNPGSGGPFAESLGDYGAIPADDYAGSAVCTTGLDPDYDITQFEISWCQVAGPVTGSVIWLDFWNWEGDACQPGAGPISSTRPPSTTTVLSATITGLPRTNSIGTQTCYVLNLTLVTPGFNLNGSSSFTPGTLGGDKFAWAFTIPTTTGGDGPIISGNITPFSSPCNPCQGTIWEPGGQTTVAGTGGGQTAEVFFDDYGGTSLPAGAGDCYFFGGGAVNVPGPYLHLFADKPGLGGDIPSTPFCDASDNSLVGCPCTNPGNADTGCDTPIPVMQGGGLTGGVNMVPTAQQTTPANRATLTATGFPAGSLPGFVCFRNTGLDPLAPVVFGDGIRCVLGTGVIRLGAGVASGGTGSVTFGHGTMAPTGTLYYQLWFRSTPISYCDPVAAFNLSNGLTLNW